jgi:hypothetical protein
LSPGTAGTWVNAVGEAVLPLINRKRLSSYRVAG